jgi:predicted enzyme related to lactoylglutathione lyase
MQASYVFAGLHVTDRDGAVRWYERLFGRSPDFLPRDDEAVWQVAATASLYLRVDVARAGGGVVTLIVADLDMTVADLAERGILPGAIMAVGDAGRKAVVQDSDGNAIEIVQLA